MNAAKCVIVSAAGAGRAEMVAKALAGNFGPFDCPAGLVEALGGLKTLITIQGHSIRVSW